MFSRVVFGLLLVLARVTAVHAQDGHSEKIDFTGGKLEITEDGDQKVLSFNGKELVRNYSLMYERTVHIEGLNTDGVDVALFLVGPGGNACAESSFLVWKPENEDTKTARAGDDCSSPPPSVNDYGIYFVPHLLAGQSEPVQLWTPETGLRTVGNISFAAQPGTKWTDIAPSKISDISDVFSNESAYNAAQSLLGGELTNVATNLVVSDGIHTLPSGIFYGTGCAPHACGDADGFMAVDTKGRKLYFAQQRDGPEPKTWPALAEWPADVKKGYAGFLQTRIIWTIQGG